MVAFLVSFKIVSVLASQYVLYCGILKLHLKKADLKLFIIIIYVIILCVIDTDHNTHSLSGSLCDQIIPISLNPQWNH